MINVVGTDEVQRVKAWALRWDNRDRETTKIATTTLNVLLTLHGAKLKMSCQLNSWRTRK